MLLVAKWNQGCHLITHVCLLFLSNPNSKDTAEWEETAGDEEAGNWSDDAEAAKDWVGSEMACDGDGKAENSWDGNGLMAKLRIIAMAKPRIPDDGQNDYDWNGDTQAQTGWNWDGQAKNASGAEMACDGNGKAENSCDGNG